MTLGSAWESEDTLQIVQWVYEHGGPAGSMTGHPIRLPDGSEYVICEWDDGDEMEGAA